MVVDEDAPAWTPELFARAIARNRLDPVPWKSLPSLRNDVDVPEWFRSHRRGYQSRMNARLRADMKAHKQTTLPVNDASVRGRIALKRIVASVFAMPK
ncbi:MAG: BrnA antitoxin family protein [Burkholderiales bacterium]